MADDDKENDSGLDPWAGIESGSSPDLSEGFSFSFEEAVADASASPVEDAAAEVAEPASTPAPLEDAAQASAPADPDDDLVNSWLDDEAEATTSAAGPLGVFTPEDDAVEDAVAGQSSIQIGTGESGTHSPSSIEAAGFATNDGEISASGAEPADDFAAWGTVSDDESPAEAGFAGDESGPDVIGEEMFASLGESADDGETASMFAGVGADAAEPSADAEADVIDFATAAATGAAAAAATVATRPGKQPAQRKKKAGGLGQMLGVVIGGALAIPIVLGILVGLMWLGWKDTIGIRRMMPDQLAFLLPPKRAAGAIAGGSLPDLSNAPTLDDLASAVTDVASAVAAPPSDEPASSEPASTGDSPEPTEGEPKPAPAGEPGTEPDLSATATAPAPPAPVDPAAPAPTGDDPLAGLLDEKPAAPAAKDLATAPAADPLAGLLDGGAATPQAPAPAPAPPAPPEPPPLDTEPLENAVGAAAAALASLEEAVEPAEPVREQLLVDWYKSLARVAEEFAALEAVAVESGRPLAHAPDQVVALHDGIVSNPERIADLTRLARNWLDYGRRGSEGIVVPATFNGARKIGPYWCAKVALSESDEKARNIAVISRGEPAAAPGELVVITGLTLDGAVVWAADIRAAKPAAAVERRDAGDVAGERAPARPAPPADDDPLAGLLGEDEPVKPAAPVEQPRGDDSGLPDTEASPPPTGDQPPAADAPAASEPKPAGEPDAPAEPAPAGEPPAGDEPGADAPPAPAGGDPLGESEPAPAEPPAAGGDSEP